MTLKKRLARSGKIWLSQWKYQPLFYGLDLGFLVLFVTAFVGLQIMIVQKIDSVLGLVQEELSRLTGGGFTDSSLVTEHYDQLLAANPELSRLFGEIILVFLGLVAVLYLIFCLFQGAAWALSNKVVHGMKNPLRYIGRFFTLNLVWSAALIFILYVWFNLTVYNMKSFVPVITPSLLNAFMVIVLCALGYFAVISYVITNTHTTWKTLGRTFTKGAEQVADLLLMFVVLVGMIGASVIITYFLFRVSFIGSIVAILVIIVPTLSFSRVFAMVSVGEIVKD